MHIVQFDTQRGGNGGQLWFVFLARSFLFLFELCTIITLTHTHTRTGSAIVHRSKYAFVQSIRLEAFFSFSFPTLRIDAMMLAFLVRSLGPRSPKERRAQTRE
jgi:hypothetical protein